MNQKDNNGLISDIVHIILFPTDPPDLQEITYRIVYVILSHYLKFSFKLRY